jgi:hypothetical protein
MAPTTTEIAVSSDRPKVSVSEPQDIGFAPLHVSASGKLSLLNVWEDADACAPGTMNQTMYK